MVGSCKAHTIRPSDIMYTETLCVARHLHVTVSQGVGGARSSSSLSCTCTCITNYFFSLTDTTASASAILLQHYVRCIGTQQQCEARHKHNQHVITHLNDDAIDLLPFSLQKQMALILRWNSSCQHSCQPVSATNTLDANSPAQEHKCNRACHIALEAVCHEPLCSLAAQGVNPVECDMSGTGLSGCSVMPEASLPIHCYPPPLQLFVHGAN